MTQTRANHPDSHLKAKGAAFVAGFVIMAIELLAARIMAPYLGSSLYTWTAVIMAVMAGVALGAWTGGKLADRKNVSRSLTTTLFLSSIFVLLIPIFSEVAGKALSGSGHSVQILALLFAYIVFFPSSALLGSLTPQLVKRELKHIQESGSMYGMISAWNAAGSIAGTYITGFLFIGYLHVKTAIDLMAGVVLLLACIAFFLKTEKDSVI